MPAVSYKASTFIGSTSSLAPAIHPTVLLDTVSAGALPYPAHTFTVFVCVCVCKWGKLREQTEAGFLRMFV